MSDPVLEAVVVGVSAGAVDALSVLLPSLPTTFPLPIIVVVHIPPDKPSVMGDLFRTRCSIRVSEVEDKQPIERGTVYFAPPNYHLLVEAEKSFALSADEPVLYSRPSIDVTFESAADVFGAGLLGIILTGANHDGAHGLAAIIAAGGSAIVQDPSEAFVSTMPEAAIANCPGATVMPLHDIATFLKKVL